MPIKLISFRLCPFVQRAVITLLEKGVEFDLTYIDLDDPPEWFRELSPLGKVPLLVVERSVLFESAVILDYLDEVYAPRLHPEDPLTRAQHKAWIEYGSGLLMQQHALAVAPDREHYERALGEMNGLLERLQTPLQEGLFGGDNPYSLVEAAFAPFFLRLQILAGLRREVTAELPPGVKAWSDGLLARASTRDSVVEDFSSSYLHFLRQKDSWLADPTRS